VRGWGEGGERRGREEACEMEESVSELAEKETKENTQSGNESQLYNLNGCNSLHCPRKEENNIFFCLFVSFFFKLDEMERKRVKCMHFICPM